MDRPAGQSFVSGGLCNVVLVSQLTEQQAALRVGDAGQHHRHGVVPPRQAAQVGLLARVIPPGQVHARQHLANTGAVSRRGCQLAFTAKFVHHSRRLALETKENFALFVGRRVRHQDAVPGQVLHQVQIKRQLLKRQPFKQGQHVLTLGGIYKIIGVLDATGAALDGLQLTQVQRTQKSGSLFERDLSKNSHA